jgi:thiol-disulfide isomerase/thioredoxin
MIVELTPETYFKEVYRKGPLHVVMHFGATCGPCKMTMPYYDAVEQHFVEYKVTNVKFYWFHQWEPSYKDFIDVNNLKTNGVPTFRYFYDGEIVEEQTRSFNNADELKQSIMGVVRAIETTILNGEFNLYAS